MLTIAAGIILAVAILAVVPLLLYWMIWLMTDRGRQPLSQAQLDHERQMRRAKNIADLKRLGVAMAGLALFLAGIMSIAVFR